MIDVAAHVAEKGRHRIGILLTNLGTPDAPTKEALRRYLKEFLSDQRVVEANPVLWWLVLNGIILNTRPAKSAKAYQAVWTDAGSPLMLYTQQQAAGLREYFANRGDVQVEVAMRYGNPSIASGLQALRQQGCGKILVLPMYPQYAAATTGSTFDAVSLALQEWRWVPELRFVNTYHDREDYIAALASSVQSHWQKHGKPQRLLMSFHGIPQRYFDAGDPYPCLCRKTARLLAERLQLGDEDWSVAFQSRFGREEWVQPYTDAILKLWGAEGVEHVQVICPGFAADCLETIEEIGEENRDCFLQAGGKTFSYIPALNANIEHVQMLAKLCEMHIQGW